MSSIQLKKNNCLKPLHYCGLCAPQWQHKSMPVLGVCTSKPSVLPDKDLKASTGDSFWDVGEKLQAELTQKVVLPLQGQEHKVRTHTVEGHDGKWSHWTQTTLDWITLPVLRNAVCVIQFMFAPSLCKPTQMQVLAVINFKNVKSHIMQTGDRLNSFREAAFS